MLGPLQNQHAVRHGRPAGRRRARRRRRTVLVGGEPDTEAPGYFYPTTLVADVDDGNPLVAEEQFGPALPIIRYTDLDEVIAARQRRSTIGLGASVWSQDVRARHATSPRGSRRAPSGSTRTATSTR